MTEMVFLGLSVLSEDQECDERAKEHDAGDTAENDPGDNRYLKGPSCLFSVILRLFRKLCLALRVHSLRSTGPV